MEYEKYCKYYKVLWEYLTKHSPSIEELTKEICRRRGYKDVKRWELLFNKTGLAKVKMEDLDMKGMRKLFPEEMGIIGDQGFLLENSYMIPIRDMLGNIIAIVGWLPENKAQKYITTPSEYFDKSCLFFGLEQFADYNPLIYGKDKLHPFFVVEGIFDSLALRSLGFRCLGNMGINGSIVKSRIFNLCSRIVAIPDGDKQGLRVIQTDEWKLPTHGTYVVIPQGIEGIKDVDDIIKSCPPEQTIPYFASFFKEKNRKIFFEIE